MRERGGLAARTRQTPQLLLDTLRLRNVREMRFAVETHERHVRFDELVLLHPAEKRLIEYIRKLRYGTILTLKVQDGLPVLAEETLKKVKFADGGDGH